MKVHCLFGVGGKQLPSGNDNFSRWNLTNKKHKQLFGIPFDVQLGAPFFVKGNCC